MSTDWIPWAWLIGGLALCAAESVVPGVFLLWIGLAALVLGTVELAFAISLAPSLLLFGTFAVLFSLAGSRLYGSWQRSTGQVLNNRAAALTGRVLVLSEPIVDGCGRARVQDTVWRVTGPDLPAGTRVRVAGVADGVVLQVEPA